ncbi:MAG: peptide-methionine (S)-S-oxide reductase MsrA [bacterium]
MEKAILAGGCFWGMQDLLRKIEGVSATRVGYTGGTTANATYEQVKTGTTGHAEAIEILYDPNQISYRKILEWFFQIHDPTTRDRQGNDRGAQYRSEIFYTTDAQAECARDLIQQIEASGKWPGAVVTEITKASAFWPAEEIHQDYLETYPDGYTCHFVRPDWHL